MEAKIVSEPKYEGPMKKVLELDRAIYILKELRDNLIDRGLEEFKPELMQTVAINDKLQTVLAEIVREMNFDLHTLNELKIRL